MEKFIDHFKAGLQLGLRVGLSGNVQSLIGRAVAVSLFIGVVAGAIAGASLFVPVTLGIAALGCIVYGGTYVFAASTALSGKHKDLFAKSRFQPLIHAAQGSAIGGIVLLGGAMLDTEMRRERPVAAPAVAAAQVFARPDGPFVTASSAVTVAAPRR